jgi:hypothetical protein
MKGGPRQALLIDDLTAASTSNSTNAPTIVNEVLCNIYFLLTTRIQVRGRAWPLHAGPGAGLARLPQKRLA